MEGTKLDLYKLQERGKKTKDKLKMYKSDQEVKNSAFNQKI
jgi:hypothetical protein